MMLAKLSKTYNYHVMDTYDPTLNVDSGLMILSKQKMTNKNIFYFKNTGAWFSNKAVLSAEIPGFRYVVATTHLDTKRSIARAELISVLNTYNNRNTYLCGDMNMSSIQLPTYSKWKTHSPVHNVNSNFENTRRIDHCLTTLDDLSAIVYIDRSTIELFISDHAALHVQCTR